MTTTMTVHEAGQVFVDPAAHTDPGRFHAACAVLRDRSPVHRVEHPDFNPFWAITRHADVIEVESRPDVFRNGPRPVLVVKDMDRFNAEHPSLRTLIHMDDPEHRIHRAMTADWFGPKSLGRYEASIAALARDTVSRMAEAAAAPGGIGECDFAADIAVQFPLQGILAILGLPESDYPKMLKLTQEIFGLSDPERSRGQDPSDLLNVVGDFFAYFYNVTADRRAKPTGDLASVIANATVDGRPIGDLEMISYYIIIATAGHDTTASTIAGGLEALARHPDQLERMRRDPSLMATAADEMIRWVSPVTGFMRTAAIDTTVDGTKIPAGDSVLLSYTSANRDERAFADPSTFDVGRNPNRHLGFGFGSHFCLGAAFARMEIRALFAELVPRLAHVELAGEPEMTRTLFVGGLKHLPIRFSLRAHGS